MRVLWFIAAGSAALLLLSLVDPAWQDWVMLAGPCLVASIFLIFREHFLDRNPATRLRPWTTATPNWIVVDGSNVMHWNENQPSLDTLRWVLEDLMRRGFVPGVIFDANAGYKVKDRYMDDDVLARELGLPEAQVLVVPRGTPADEYILDVARKLGARVVTNDRFRDWAERFPEVHDPNFLIRGGARPGHVWLEDTARAREPA